MTQTTTGDLDDDEEAEEENNDILVHGRKKRKVAFMPSLGEYSHSKGHRIVIHFPYYMLSDTTHTIYYRGHWLRVSQNAVPPFMSLTLCYRSRERNAIRITAMVLH